MATPGKAPRVFSMSPIARASAATPRNMSAKKPVRPFVRATVIGVARE